MSNYTYSGLGGFSAFPPVIKNLLIINVLVFLAQFLAESTLLRWFALWPLNADFFIISQLVTYSFLHGGLSHIFFNMFALWMFGVQIENTWGSRRFFIYYFACVVGAALVQLAATYVSNSMYPTIGASGGVFGILLAFGMMFPDQQIALLFPPVAMKAKYFVIGYGCIELFFATSGMQPGVANLAHLGGMVFGLLLILYWRGRLPIKPNQTSHY